LQKAKRLFIAALFGSIIFVTKVFVPPPIDRLLIAFLPFSFIFTFLYGIIVDVFFFLFKVNAAMNEVNRNRLMLAMAFSTLLIGFLSYFVTALGLEVIPINPVLDMLVLFMGPVSGAVAGYAASYLWNKYLKSISP
jgi:hypothetical protein